MSIPTADCQQRTDTTRRHSPQQCSNGQPSAAGGRHFQTKTVMKLAALLVLLFCTALLIGCATDQRATPTPSVLRIAGATSLQPALEALAAAYESEHPQVLVEVRGGGTAVGQQFLRQGQIDLAALSWLAPDEPEDGQWHAVPIARDGIAIIVHPSNAITNLTFLQLRAIYRGEILDWGAVGGAGGVPVVTSREEGSGTRAGFEAMVMGGAQATLNAVVLPTSKAMVDYVASHRNAIGYVSTNALTDQVRVVAVEEVMPTSEILRAGAYPLGRVLYLYAPRSPSPGAKSFMDFTLSSSGQAVISRYLVPIR